MKYKEQNQAIPARTAELAKKVFKKGNRYLKIRDEMGIVFENKTFKHLFSHQGRAAEAPGNLASSLVMHHLEGLSDREPANWCGRVAG
jgi:transposase